MQAALLPDRGVVKVVGDDARRFLNGVITADTRKVSPQAARFGGLLTPQGKIIADFIIAEARPEDGGGFFLDCPRALAPELMQRLNLYRLRAKVIIEDLSDVLGVMAVWGGPGPVTYGLSYADPRLPELGWRLMLPPHRAAEAAAALGAELVEAASYEAHRIALGVPRGGADFAYGDAFPHETDMDQLAGIDFAKGCYVGQEVVSRMEHRATARTRVVPVVLAGPAPEPGTPVLAGDKTIGSMGSSGGGRGLALLRLERLADAMAAGATLRCGDARLVPEKPGWARFDLPGAKAAE